jgi:hypothetical protein
MASQNQDAENPSTGSVIDLSETVHEAENHDSYVPTSPAELEIGTDSSDVSVLLACVGRLRLTSRSKVAAMMIPHWVCLLCRWQDV